MAEETSAAGKAGGGGLIKKIVAPVIIGVVGIAVALAVFWLVIKPRLTGEGSAAEEKAHNSIPSTAVTVAFDQFMTNAKQPPDSKQGAPLFMYKVSFECGTPLVAEIVEANKARFRDIISRPHEFKSREELTDRLFKESVEKQILQESNQLLTDLFREEKPGPDDRITAMFHDEWFIYDR